MPEDKTLKARSRELKSMLRVGKNGITETVLQELEAMLKKHQLVKVKLLKSGLGEADKDDVGETLAKKTGARIIDRIGLTVTLYKHPGMEKPFSAGKKL